MDTASLQDSQDRACGGDDGVAEQAGITEIDLAPSLFKIMMYKIYEVNYFN